MCNHHNTVLDEYGTSTCLDCNIHFDKSFCSEYTTNHNGPIIRSKSSTHILLEKDFGINDCVTIKITEEIFNLTSKNKMVKGTNKRSILCASLYYAYHYLKKPKNFEEMLIKFKINHKNGSKGLKLCQIAIQEHNFDSNGSSDRENDIKKFKGQIHSFASTHREKLQDLMTRYNIALRYYDELEKIIIAGHLKKNKLLNDRVNNLWISCIFFWILKINPYLDPEEFISLYEDISLSQLKSDLTYLEKNLN